MAKPCILLVDFNNMLYRAVFANKGLSHQGMFTGGLYGFLNMICGAINRYDINNILVFSDMKPYHRAKYYAQYKHGRGSSQEPEDVERIAVARSQIRSFLLAFKIPWIADIGYEADDYIGKYCRSRKDLHSRILIMSNDSDFYQLLGGVAGKVFLVKTSGLYGQHQFKEDYPDIDPVDWPRVIALKGSHNGVAGIKGVGDITAVRLVADRVTDEDIEEKYFHSTKEIQLRTQLAYFPFTLIRGPRLPFPRGRSIKYSVLKFQEICDQYGIRFKDEFHTAFKRLSK